MVIYRFYYTQETITIPAAKWNRTIMMGFLYCLCGRTIESCRVWRPGAQTKCIQNSSEFLCTKTTQEWWWALPVSLPSPDHDRHAHKTHTHSHTRTAHINTTSDNQSTKQISWLQWAKKKTFKCSEGERLVPLEFGALVCEIWSDHFVSDTNVK